LVERLAEFETLVTASDKEALILENNLIKQYRPRYNIRLKDDKSYVSVKVAVHDPWPRVLVTRKIVKDRSRYFGPCASAAAAGERFEDAARLRDQLRAIEKTQEPQQVVEHWGANQDVFGLYREGGSIEVQVLFVRDGKLVSNQTYAFDDWEFPDAEVLEEV